MNVEADDEATSIQSGRPEPPSLAGIDPDSTAVSRAGTGNHPFTDERAESTALDAKASPPWDDGTTLDTDEGMEPDMDDSGVEDHTEEGTGMTMRQPTQPHPDTLDVVGDDSTGITERSVVAGMQARRAAEGLEGKQSLKQTLRSSSPAVHAEHPHKPPSPAGRHGGRKKSPLGRKTTPPPPPPKSRSVRKLTSAPPPSPSGSSSGPRRKLTTPPGASRSGSGRKLGAGKPSGKSSGRRKSSRASGAKSPRPSSTSSKLNTRPKSPTPHERAPSAPKSRSRAQSPAPEPGSSKARHKKKPASQTVAEMFAPDTLDTGDVTEASKVPTANDDLARSIKSESKKPRRPRTNQPAAKQNPAGPGAGDDGEPVGAAAGGTRPETQGDHPAKSAFNGIPKRGHGPAGATKNDDLVGTVLLDRYKVLRRIGRGGMSLVYLGRHTTINKDVAIKVLAPQLAEWPVYVERFLQEARAASMIRHPNVVDINDFGYTEIDKLPFFVMEYLDGEDLRDRLAREGRLDWVNARPILLQICAALDAAHRKGVIHRDIKPENVFIIRQDDGSELVKLLDFGIAKVASETEPGSLTSHGVVLGTVDYISPERANKENVDLRADIYSLGVLVYRMVTGKLPFTGDAVDIVTAHVYNKPPLPTRVAPEANISAELQDAIMCSLAKKPGDRFQNITEFSTALQSVPIPGMAGPMDGSGLFAGQRASTLPPLPRAAIPGFESVHNTVVPGQMQSPFANQSDQSSSRFKATLVIGIAIVVLLGVVIALLLRQENQDAPESEPTGQAVPAFTSERVALSALGPEPALKSIRE